MLHLPSRCSVTKAIPPFLQPSLGPGKMEISSGGPRCSCPCLLSGPAWLSVPLRCRKSIIPGNQATLQMKTLIHTREVTADKSEGVGVGKRSPSWGILTPKTTTQVSKHLWNVSVTIKRKTAATLGCD
ncbi:hypothetical protein HJG60_009081 [Phyllostomus discolor]|uniref:Uncharacterized protein n=1 Tax=Phyllostomus discolor TaxID=89673 RepID=A0A833YLZ8_9CHIR|nr:hypothetical protein HJG60_009081 [Phyllostomus discolor]